jgi:nucleotide-binding universal stress UspA family protein
MAIVTIPLSGPLLCGVDFSEPSRRALQVALVLSRRLDAPLTVVTVVHPLLAHAAEMQLGTDRFTRETSDDLSTFVAGSVPSGATWVPQTTHRVVVGDPATSILHAAAAESTSIVVVGTRGLGRTGRLFFGSTTATLLKKSTHPILAVPDGDQHLVDLGASEARLNVERLVCAFDLDDVSANAAAVAFAFGRRLALPVSLLHAAPKLAGPEDWAPLLESSSRESAAQVQSQMAAWLAKLREQAPVTVRTGTPAEVLTAEVASGPSAWLVMGLGAAGRTPGSTATQVLAESHVPVLAVPPV